MLSLISGGVRAQRAARENRLLVNALMGASQTRSRRSRRAALNRFPRGRWGARVVWGWLVAHRMVLGVSVAAAVLRWAALGGQSYWYDESLTVDEVRLPLGSMLALVGRQETSPPLYFLLAWGWRELFGSSELALRSLSALLGTCTVPAVYAAARAFFTRRAAVITAALVAVNPMLVWYSQEARPYALLVALSAVSLWCLAQVIEDGGGGWMMGWVLSASAALATHFFAGFLIFAEAAWLLATRRSRVSVSAGMAVGAAQAALLPLALADRAHGLAYIHAIPLMRRLGDTALEFTAGNLDGRVDSVLLIAATAGTAGWALQRLRRDATGRERHAARPSVFIAAAALSLPVGLALVSGGLDYVYARNLIPALLPIIMLISAGLTVKPNRPHATVASSALAALGVTMTLLVGARTDLQRPAWHRAARALGRPRTARAVLAVGEWQAQPLKLYLPHARWPTPRRATIGEIDLVGRQKATPVPRPRWPGPLAKLQPMGSRRSGPFVVARYLLPRRESIHLDQLARAGQGLFTRPPGRLLALVQPAKVDGP